MIYQIKDIPNFPGYQIDTNGDVWSSKTKGINKKITPCIRNKYVGVSLRKDKKNHSKHIHRLMLEAFVGVCPEGMEACHNNGNKTDNSLENLRWDTSKNNHIDRRKHGTMPLGEQCKSSKLKAEQVIKIRELFSTGKYSFVELGRMFNISNDNVGHIVRRERWTHLL